MSQRLPSLKRECEYYYLTIQHSENLTIPGPFINITTHSLRLTLISSSSSNNLSYLQAFHPPHPPFTHILPFTPNLLNNLLRPLPNRLSRLLHTDQNTLPPITSFLKSILRIPRNTLMIARKTTTNSLGRTVGDRSSRLDSIVRDRFGIRERCLRNGLSVLESRVEGRLG